MEKVLVLGGAGYVGSVLTANLLNDGFFVRSLDNFLYQNNHCVLPWIGNTNFEFLNRDLIDASSLDGVFEGVSSVIILAGMVGDPITKKYPIHAKKINDDAILNVIQNLNGRGLKNVIFVSTCSNYGLISDDEIADEDYILNPLSLYAESKVRVERHLLSLIGKVDYQPTILRFATAFGISPRMRFDLTVSEFTLQLASGRELVVYDADTWRPYCHVEDFADLMITVLKSSLNKVGFKVFNAGGDKNNFTKRMIVEEIRKNVPDANITYQAEGGDPRNYRVSFKKVREELGFQPKFLIADGINELLNAIQQNVFEDYIMGNNRYGNYELK